MPRPDVATSAPAARSLRAAIGFGAGSLLAVVLFYSAFVIRDFSGPIGDWNESFLHEYLAWYAGHHLTFWPVPHLALQNNEVLYPFGANGALQSWCVERDILYAWLSRYLPFGPLLQIYYLGGVALSTVGCFLLLRRGHGDARAALTTVLIHAFNFYSMQKYPYHYNIGCCHWATLGIVCDFVICERFVEERHVPLRLLLLRVLLVVLSFGLELGHVLGFALTSVLFSTTFLIGWAIRESRAGRFRATDLYGRLRREAGAHTVLCVSLVVATLAVAWLYGSVVTGIVIESLRLKWDEGSGGGWWASPLRLLIPYTPWLHGSMQPRFLHVLGDTAETGIGGGGAGWLLLIVGVVGVYQSCRQARRRILPMIPLLAMFAFYVLSTPSLPLMHVLPWFAFARVYSRATLVYSCILALLGIDVSFAGLSSRRKLALGIALFTLAATELYTIVLIQRGHAAYSFSPAQRAYLETIRRQPGEAVLDFPFCIAGGNGDIGGLCPLWERLKGVYALQRFHGKKVIGQYMGRLHRSQIRPFIDEGWDRMNSPDLPDIARANRQTRCLTDVEWAFFTQFYTSNDFAGIQLAVDRLPEGCPEEFFRRFGSPVATMELANAGRLSWIPRQPALYALIDKDKAREARLPFPPLTDVELVTATQTPNVHIERIRPLEQKAAKRWRWAESGARLKFNLAKGGDLEMLLRYQVHTGGVDVAIDADENGATARFVEEQPQPDVQRTIRLHLAAGMHEIRFTMARANQRSWPQSDWPPRLELHSLHLRPPQ